MVLKRLGTDLWPMCRAAERRAGDEREPGEPFQLRVAGEPLAPGGGSLHPDGGRQGGIHFSIPHFQPPDVLPRLEASQIVLFFYDLLM
jgi:hypothetical protein